MQYEKSLAIERIYIYIHIHLYIRLTGRRWGLVALVKMFDITTAIAQAGYALLCLHT